MKQLIFSFCLAIFVVSSRVNAEWLTWEHLCTYAKEELESQYTELYCIYGLLVTQVSPFPVSWAGEVMRLHRDGMGGRFKKAEIKVTWVADRSPFKCGSLIEMQIEDVKSFSNRLPGMKRCK